MANQQPTVAELLAQIQQLQAQVNALGAALPAPAVAAPAAPVVFADTPNTWGVEDIIDYKTKQGASIYERGCQALDDKALTDGFNMIPNETVVFIEAFECKAKLMGWSTGTKQITTFGQFQRSLNRHHQELRPN